MGVIKHADAPKHIAIKNGRGSHPIPSAIRKLIGVKIIATTALDRKAVNKNVTR